MKNGQIVSDKIQLADLPIQDLVLYGRKLRMARLRDGERAETAQWWAPASDEIAGFSVDSGGSARTRKTTGCSSRPATRPALTSTSSATTRS
jgi:hypothetical protein